MSTLTMVRTVCCESHVIHGKRCSLCPNRPENLEAVENYKRAVRNFSLRTAVAACESTGFTTIPLASTALEQAPALGH